MRLEWIDDILAVLDCGSLARAAEKRFLTQSAFTRRIKMIETQIGTELFDRSRKPVELLPAARALEQEMRAVSLRLRKLQTDLKNTGKEARRTLAFACLHSIMSTISPQIVTLLTHEHAVSVRVQSGNRDECLLMLLSGAVDFAVLYETPDELVPVSDMALDTVTLGHDTLLPVCAPSLEATSRAKEIPLVGYPEEVFLGKVFRKYILPSLSDEVEISTLAETELTLAAHQYALNGIGVVWLPWSLVEENVAKGELLLLDHLFPTQPLDIKMIRLAETGEALTDTIWASLLAALSNEFSDRPSRFSSDV